MNRSTIMVSLALALAACGDGAAALPDAGPHVDAGPEPTSRGEFSVVEAVDVGFNGSPTHEYGSVGGFVRSGASPVWQHEVMNDGTCRLLLFEPAECNPYCEQGVCVATNHCEPFPSYLSVGTVTVRGLAVGTMQLEPFNGQNWYFPSDPPPGELFADDARIQLSATGAGAIPAFATETPAVPRLETEIHNFEITLKDDEDYVLRWTPAGDREQRVQLTINANNIGHGTPYNGIIACEAYDDAHEIRVPRAMIAAFPETENWNACAGSDCPRSWVRRYRRSYATVPGGGVRLDVASLIGFGVVHRH